MRRADAKSIRYGPRAESGIVPSSTAIRSPVGQMLDDWLENLVGLQASPVDEKHLPIDQHAADGTLPLGGDFILEVEEARHGSRPEEDHRTEHSEDAFLLHGHPFPWRNEH